MLVCRKIFDFLTTGLSVQEHYIKQGALHFSSYFLTEGINASSKPAQFYVGKIVSASS